MRNAIARPRWMHQAAVAPIAAVAAKLKEGAFARTRREQLVSAIAHDTAESFLRVRRATLHPARSPDVK
jgi:hypothetical protein